MNATLQGRVQQVIDGLVESGDEIGLQVAAYVNGELVVDTWSGVADEDTGQLVDGDTLQPSNASSSAPYKLMLLMPGLEYEDAVRLAIRLVVSRSKVVILLWVEVGVNVGMRVTEAPWALPIPHASSALASPRTVCAGRNPPRIHHTWLPKPFEHTWMRQRRNWSHRS